MVWERIKRISDAELTSNAGKEEGTVQLDRPPPAGWARLFQSASGPHLELASGLSGQALAITVAPGDEDAGVANADARILHTNLLYESECLTPAVLDLLEELGARDPAELIVRNAQTAGPDRDREEADRAAHELSNEPVLLVENEETALSQPIDQALCAQLLKAGCTDKRT